MGTKILACIVSLKYNETTLFEDLRAAIIDEASDLDISKKDFDIFFQDSDNDWVRIRNAQALLGFMDDSKGPIYKLTACFHSSKIRKRGMINLFPNLYLKYIFQCEK